MTQEASFDQNTNTAETSGNAVKVDWKSPLTWVQTIPADFNDMTTFHHMLALAQGKLDEHERIGEQFPAEMREAEWDSLFAEDNDGHREAIRLIKGKLAALGVDPEAVMERIKTSPLYGVRRPLTPTTK